jgi:hypothetical protein
MARLLVLDSDVVVDTLGGFMMAYRSYSAMRHLVSSLNRLVR